MLGAQDVRNNGCKEEERFHRLNRCTDTHLRSSKPDRFKLQTSRLRLQTKFMERSDFCEVLLEDIVQNQLPPHVHTFSIQNTLSRKYCPVCLDGSA